MKRKNRIYMAAMLFGLVLALTACGKREPEDIGGDLEQLEEDGTAQTKGEGINAMVAVDEEKWVDSVTLGSKTINIDAEIVLPEVDSMKIVSLEKQKMDAGYKKSMLEKLCEQPYVLDELDPPQWYIDKHRENLEVQRKIYQSGATDPADKDIYEYGIHVLEAWESRDAGAFQDKISNDYEEAEYYGEYRGNIYDIVISDGMIFWEPIDYREMTHFQLSSGDIAFGLYGFGDSAGIEAQKKGLEALDNHCEMSIEEAQKMAEDFIQGLGYTDFSCSVINALSWQDIEEDYPEMYLDGYQFIFYKDIDGITLNANKTDFGCLKHGAPDKGYEKLESFSVSVTDAGVIAISALNLHEEKEILTENTSLLSYQQVKDVFKSVLSEDPAYFQFIATAETLNVLELMYYLVEDEDTLVMMPVWRLSQQKTHYDIEIQEDVIDTTTYALMINAVDGSVIDSGPVEMNE